MLHSFKMVDTIQYLAAFLPHTDVPYNDKVERNTEFVYIG